ncbi:MAG: acetolactate synthase [Deltaproteobacteria bacterium]|nr:acetolactate synthase [Deltaproteobacteria bacterium]
MAVKQISVLLGNIPGTLSRLTNILDKEDITAKALLAASAAESSMVRMVVNDPERARMVVNDPERAAAILESFGFNYEVTPVLAAEVPLHPGGINAILNPLTKAEINIHYLYTTINRIGEETIVILGVDKIDEAREVLQRNWIHLIEDEIYSL